MISPARNVSYELLCKIELESLFSDDAVNSPAVAQLDLRDRHLTTELILGTLRWRGLLDHVLAEASSRPWRRVDPRLRILLRMSLHQMWRMDRIPDHALVNDAVEMAKRRIGIGAGSFVNAILRKLGRGKPWEQASFMNSCSPWTRVSLPQWLWVRWSSRFGETQASEYAMSLNETPHAAFRILNSSIPPDLEQSSWAVSSDLVPGAHILTDGGKSLPAVSALRSCFQDEASQLIPYLLGSVRGWTIWDVCAAPGGKSAILSAICGGTGFVVSSDLSWPRAGRLIRTLSRICGGRYGIVILDARKPPPFRTPFDAVLADVPCSGLGTLRRNPEIKWRFRPEQLSLFQLTQKEILNSVFSAVRVGGYLLYSTCSTEPEENEEVVWDFLARWPQFKLVTPLHPAGLETFLDAGGLMRTFPGTRLWDGFFAALMLRDS